jgi:uncharacterized protein YndB with AHSA1/START domain
MNLHTDEDRIEKQIELNAPQAKVWRALTDYREFSLWFCANLEKPFQVGESTEGQITYPGYEHLRMNVVVEKMEPETYFSFTWHPYAVDPTVDYSQEPCTLIEFSLKRLDDGRTRLTVTESGFAKLSSDRRAEAFRANSEGWEEQLRNIEKYVAQTS